MRTRSSLLLLLVTAAAFGCELEPPAAPIPSGPPPTSIEAAPLVKEEPLPTAAAPAPPPPTAPKAPVAIEEYFKIRRTAHMSFSFDEKLVAYMNDQGGRPNVWVQPVSGGPATQITHVEGFLMAFAFSPAADHLVYEADKGGDELPHLFLTNSKGEAPKDLNADYPAGARVEFLHWADDGKTFLFLGSARDPKYLDLYEYSIKKGKAEKLWESSGKIAFALADRSHTRFILNETITDADSNLYLLERGSKKPVLLTAHKGEVLYDPKAFSRDDKTLYFTSDQGGEFTSLMAMDLKKKSEKPVLAPSWDVDNAGFSHNWKYFWTVTNVDGSPELKIEESATHKDVALSLPAKTGWEPAAFSKSDRFIGLSLHGDTAPTTLYVVDTKDGKATKVAETLPESLRAREMVDGRSVKVPSFDGKPVPAFLYRPAGAGPFPAVIDVHGGPTGQSHHEFSAIRQYLVSKGYVVLVPNVRGSTGYGKSYTKLDNLDLGGGPLQDVVACKKWLVKEANVDAAKVVVMGGSYGGYMALAAASFTPDEFAASVDYFGVSDLKSLVESFPPYWQTAATYIYKKFGDPKNPADAKYQHDRSPLYSLDKVKSPLLIVQGEKDARVKKDQSDRVVEALTKRQVPVHYLVLANEGHGFSKNENRLKAYEATDRFLDHYIWGDTSVDVLGNGGGKK